MIDSELGISKKPMVSKPQRPALHGEFPEPVDEMLNRASYGRGMFAREVKSFSEFYEGQRYTENEPDVSLTSGEHLEEDTIGAPTSARVGKAALRPIFAPPTAPGDYYVEAFMEKSRTYPNDDTTWRFMEGKAREGSQPGDKITAAFMSEGGKLPEQDNSNERQQSGLLYDARVAIGGMKRWLSERVSSFRRSKEQVEDPFAPRVIYDSEGNPTDTTVPPIKI